MNEPSHNLQVKTVSVSPIQQNARILYVEGGRDAVVVDPGGEAKKLFRALDELELTPTAIWLTHSHLDHCGAVATFLEKYPVPFFAHPADKFWRGKVEESAKMFGIPDGHFFDCPEPTDELLGGEVLRLGDLDFEVFFTPGHSPGHVVFYQKENGLVLGGDCLFKGSIGRTDFEGCNQQELIASIHNVLFKLPDETLVLSGHGPDTEIGTERRSNPFV
jgi:glyoxylase-like metal-dependent hydrolase (beta-lactamase superfamily II)